MEPNVTSAVTPAPAARRPYAAPKLTDFGPVAELTQGATGAAGIDAGIYS